VVPLSPGSGWLPTVQVGRHLRSGRCRGGASDVNMTRIINATVSRDKEHGSDAVVTQDEGFS
jgi:hypothetical protein